MIFLISNSETPDAIRVFKNESNRRLKWMPFDMISTTY